MFKAIGRLFKAIWYYGTFQFNKAASLWEENPGVVKQRYLAVVEEKKSRANSFKEALAGLVAQEEQKKSTLKKISNEIVDLKTKREGAKNLAAKIANELGNDEEKCKVHTKFIECRSFFKDASSTLAEKEKRCAELEEDIKGLASSVAGYKTQLISIVREIEKIRQESDEAVADIISSKEQAALADAISGITEDKTSEELNNLRDLRNKTKAKTRISSELAGIDQKTHEEEFLAFAKETASNDEFDALIFAAKKADDSEGTLERVIEQTQSNGRVMER